MNSLVKNHKYTIYFILFLTICICGMFGMSQGVRGEVIPYCVEIPRDDFPVRSEPLDSSSIVTTLNQGALLYPETMSGSWYKVPFSDGIYGYVHKDYVNTVNAKASVNLFPGVSLRISPDENGKSLGICSKNTEVTITGRDGDWCRVTPYNSGESGYILESNLEVFGKELYNGTNTDQPASYLTVTANSANIRSNAGTSYDIVTTVSYGTQLTSLGTKSGTDGYTWYYVQTTSGYKGYIRGDLVAPLTIGTGLAGKTIVVDPGHGSYKTASSTVLDSGAVGPSNVKEKDINLKISLALKSYLEADGAKVIMTRTGDTGVLTLTQRAEVANTNNADLFISIHCNSSDNSTANGTETYYSVVDEFNTAISDSLKEQRKSAANSVQSNLITQIQRSNRGVKTNNFTVITKTKMPSVLVETAFISNPTEERMLNSSSFQDSAAKGCYLGIRDFFN